MSAGVVIGVVEVVLAISFAALVFGGYLEEFLPAGIGIYLIAAALTLAILAWRAGVRGVVGSVQDAAAAVLGIVAASAAFDASGSVHRAFLTVVAATVVVTLLTAATFLLLGTFRLGNLARFIPYPVVGGFLAGTGWLLMKGGLRVASGIEPQMATIGHYLDHFELVRWGPAFLFGVILLIATRIVKRPLVIPLVLGLGLVLFADRDGRDGEVGRVCAGRTVAARSVHRDANFCALDRRRTPGRGLDGRARSDRWDPHHRVRRRDGVPVQRRRRRGAAPHRPRLEPGAA